MLSSDSHDPQTFENQDVSQNLDQLASVISSDPLLVLALAESYQLMSSIPLRSLHPDLRNLFRSVEIRLRFVICQLKLSDQAVSQSQDLSLFLGGHPNP
jgi:hypothetical protein